MFAQLRTIAWLQFRLVKNSATQQMRWLGAFAWGIQVALSAFGCASITVIAFGAGFATADEDAAWVLVAILDAGLILVLFIRTIMLSVELTEADFVDTGKLLFLPIRLRTLFGINFVVRNAGGIVLLIVPPIFSLCTSLAIVHGPRMLLGIPLGLIALLTVVAWFGFIREWLLAIGENRKRALITAAMLLVSGAIGVTAIGGAYAKIRADAAAPVGVSQEKLAELEEGIEQKPVTGIVTEKQFREALLRGNAWIPLGWFPLGLYRIIDHQYRVALLGGLGLAFIAALGIASEYRLVLKRYRTSSGATTPKKTKSIPKSKWTRLTLPLLTREWSAYAGLAYLVRTRTLTFKSSHWFYGFAAIAASLIPLITDVSNLREIWWNSLAPYAVVAPVIFFSVAMSINIFGQDRTGFQVLVLMPVKRHSYILCKNAIMIAFILIWFAMLTVPCVLIFRPHPIAVTAALLIVLQAQLTLTVIGNVLSIAFPFRLKDGQLDQPAQPLAAMLPSFLAMLSLPMVFAPMAITAILNPASSWYWEIEGAWVSLASALIFLTATLCAYAASIPATAAFLANREMKMLEVLASDRE